MPAEVRCAPKTKGPTHMLDIDRRRIFDSLQSDKVVVFKKCN
jgi:hypothetical protein